MVSKAEIKAAAPAGPAGMMPPTERRVPARTTRGVNREINERTINSMKKLSTASDTELTNRIHHLQWEWDIERTIEAAASSIILTATLVIGFILRHPYLGLALAAAEGGFIMLHATYGWCPPQPVLRKFGFRTSYEIMDELVALRLLRGDFDSLIGGPNMTSAPDRKSDMLESMIRNMRDSGRLLGAF